MRNTKTRYVALLGFAIGYSVGVSFLAGGYDALTFYLKDPFPTTTAPAWVYLVTYPLSLLGWPQGWQVLTFITVLAAGAASFVWDSKNWWIALLSSPFLWNIWLGQIEFIPIIGLILAGLVLQRRIHIAWLGMSWLALLTKPQVGLGVLLLQAYWLWQDKDIGRDGLLLAFVTAAATVAMSVIIWPDWLPNWIRTMRAFKATWWNASIWPYGLLAWPIAIYLSQNADRLTKVRMFLAASLLGSPYFALYHCTTLLALSNNVLVLLLSWVVIILGKGVPSQWMKWGWVLPVGNLAADVVLLATRRLLPTDRCTPRRRGGCTSDRST